MCLFVLSVDMLILRVILYFSLDCVRYVSLSTREIGTMFQLQNLICRNVVPADPEKLMTAAEYLMLLLGHSHVVNEFAKSITDRFVHLPNMGSEDVTDTVDGVNLYSTLGFLWHAFYDAVRKADVNYNNIMCPQSAFTIILCR